MQKLTAHPTAALFPDISPKEFEELKNSISTVGLLTPLIINEAGQLVEGRQRYRACQELEIEPTTVQLKDVLGDKLGQINEDRFIFDCNYHRRHLTDDQRAALCAVFLPELRKEAQLRKSKGQQKGRAAKKLLSHESDSTENGDSDNDGKVSAKLADMAKIGRAKAEKAIDLADHDSKLLDQVSRGEKKLSEAHNELAKTKENSSPQPKKFEHWQLTKRVDKALDKFLDKLLSKIDHSQHREALRLIADACTARMEKLERGAE